MGFVFVLQIGQFVLALRFFTIHYSRVVLFLL